MLAMFVVGFVFGILAGVVGFVGILLFLARDYNPFPV